MTVDEAVKQLDSFVAAYENDTIRDSLIRKYGAMPESVTLDYMATKILIEHEEKMFKCLKNTHPLFVRVLQYLDKKIQVESSSELHQLKDDVLQWVIGFELVGQKKGD